MIHYLQHVHVKKMFVTDVPMPPHLATAIIHLESKHMHNMTGFIAKYPLGKTPVVNFFPDGLKSDEETESAVDLDPNSIIDRETELVSFIVVFETTIYLLKIAQERKNVMLLLLLVLG